MPEPPPELFEQYEALKNHIEWADSGHANEDAVQAQLIETEIHDFVARWHGHLGFPELDTAMRKLLSVADGLRGILDRAFLEDLRELVEHRHSVLLEPLLFQQSLRILEIWKLAPPELRPGLEEAIAGRPNPPPFDPDAFYREMKANEADTRTEYDHACAAMDATWGDRFTRETRDQLATADLAEAERWRRGLAQQLGVPPN